MSLGRTYALMLCALAACEGNDSGAPTVQPVVWTHLVNSSVSGTVLTKTGGKDQVDDAAALSEQQLPSGDGYFEFVGSETSTFRFVGLGASSDARGGAGIDFAFRLQGGHADAYERGVWRADNTFAPGDLLRVGVVHGIVQFSKNGQVFYRSSTAPSYPLLGRAALIDMGATVNEATMAVSLVSTADGGAAPHDGGAAGPHDGGPAGPHGGGPGRSHRFCGWTLVTGQFDLAADPGLRAFVQHADDFDAIHPVWWHIDSGDPTHLVSIDGQGSAAILDHTTYAGKRTLLIPTIAAVDGADPEGVHQMLNDPTLRDQHIATLLELAMQYRYDGLDLDYEHLPDQDRSAFTDFATQLAAALHGAKKTLSFAVDALTGPTSVWDYTALARVVDELHVMGYDFHFLGSHPGPVAPLGWLERVGSYIQSVDGGQRTSKFILGLPNYGIAGEEGQATTWAGTSMDAIQLAGGNYAVTTDHMASCPFVGGNELMASGRSPNAMTAQGHLFFDDLASMEEKVALAQSLGMGGVSYWTLGGEPDRPGAQTFFQMVRRHFPK